MNRHIITQDMDEWKRKLSSNKDYTFFTFVRHIVGVYGSWTALQISLSQTWEVDIAVLYWNFDNRWSKVDDTAIGMIQRTEYFLAHGLPDKWHCQVLGMEPLCYKSIPWIDNHLSSNEFATNYLEENGLN